MQKKELDGDKDVVLVVETVGLRKLKNANIPNMITFYIDVDDTERYLRQLKRGDNLQEVFLRSVRDEACFQEIKLEVDFVIDNNGELWDSIIQILGDVRDKSLEQ